MTIHGLNTGNKISYYDYSKINGNTDNNTTSTNKTTDTYIISDEAKAS